MVNPRTTEKTNQKYIGKKIIEENLPGTVAYNCNTSYSVGGDQKDHSSRPNGAKS
jgi:hypothetical protein